MKYKVKIDNRYFEVEIKDIHSRPIVAVVDGLEIEVWPDTETASKAEAPTTSAQRTSGQSRLAPPAETNSCGNGTSKTVCAPIPGVVVSIATEPGSEVVPGQELCVIEAMKMKNAIRATRAGRVAEVNAMVGQHVKHHDVLVVFED